MSVEIQESPAALKAMAREKVVELDVRPTLKAGGEPFNAIMDAVGKVSTDGALRLRATFEPKPLFRVLGSKGWKHWVEYGEGDDWVIWFYQMNEPDFPAALGPAAAEFPELPKRLKVDGNDWKLDVRHLLPPEPMEMTLAVVDYLPKEARLIQINQRVPQFLLPLLEQKGIKATVLKETDNEVQIEIKYR